jgi:hypothetical protein
MEYNAGRRESYYHPARMYAFISFVFFLIFFSLPDSDEAVKPDSKETNLTESVTSGETEEGEGGIATQNVDSVFNKLKKDSTLNKVLSQPWADSVKAAAKKKKKGASFNLSGSDYASVAAYDSAQQLKPEDKRDGWLVRRITIRGIELNNKYKNDSTGFGKEFGKAFMENFSKVLFFLLPFFALGLKLLYVRRNYFYSEHLVFSIYYYNFFYLAGSIQMLTNFVPWLSWMPTLIGFWIFFYLLFGMKKMYQQSWRKTIVKFFLFSVLFLMMAGLAFVINALVILFVI